MDGRLAPGGVRAARPLASQHDENVAAVQFDHRLLATVTAVLALGIAGVGWRARPHDPALRAGLAALALAVCVQYTLGVATLLGVVPFGLATAHQATAALVLTAALYSLHAAWRTGPAAGTFGRPSVSATSLNATSLNQETALTVTDRLFYGRPDSALDADAAIRATAAALARADDGELFLEWRESEQISLDDGRIRAANYDTQLGFGLRAVAERLRGMPMLARFPPPRWPARRRP